MAEYRDQFEQEQDKRPAACMLCEALLPDAVDGTLSAAEQRIFDQHVASCVTCSRELEEAHRGAAWLSMLKSQAPEPPETLLAKILAGTTGAQPLAVRDAMPGAVPAVGLPQKAPAPVQAPAHRGSSLGARFAAWRSRVADTFRIDDASLSFQPRLAMTAAMAFFSLALTLNLTGFRLRDVHAATFTPSGMQRTVADMSASAARSFQNLRVVYQVEARVSELREDETPGVGRTDRPAEQAQPEPGHPQTGKPQTDGPRTGQPHSAQPQTAEPGRQDGAAPDPRSRQDDARPRGRSDLTLPTPPTRGRSEVARQNAA